MSSENNQSRRAALKNILLISGAFCVAALGVQRFSMGVSHAAAIVNVKVVYVGMSTQTSGIKQEYLALPSPAHLDDVMSKIKENHSSFAEMLPLMQIVVNGVPTQGNPLIDDNTEVDFIPTYAGG